MKLDDSQRHATLLVPHEPKLAEAKHWKAQSVGFPSRQGRVRRSHGAAPGNHALGKLVVCRETIDATALDANVTTTSATDDRIKNAARQDSSLSRLDNRH
ncbi:hypothetical protein EW146_g2921 [Bondarzewia mesenterica]|uniref:Uncharacterized protein n=1 Tax=Bondarzewia mesenterica TaxID=1095465 RepID=A0A4S4M1F0_9AGAM|nr:hypothetical protein EW146_g2921 [Bondarzewia mesenterica]